MRRAVSLLLVCGIAASASATPEIWETFRNVYGVKPGSAFDKAQCSTCHTEIPKHNDYGVAVKASLQQTQTKRLTEAILRGVEKDDSDGDGWTNGDEIDQGHLPGDPKDHPSGAPPKKGSSPQGMGGSMMKGSAMEGSDAMHRSMMDRMVPKHSFHPVLVHFPVALFIFGAFLELVGWRLRKPGLREAAYWNLLAGSVSTTAAIATGFTVALRLGYSLLPGTAVFTHLGVAILASLTMLATVLWRRKGAHVGWGYFSLLVLAGALVGLAGHFGGGMVYG